ncbi:MAG: TetR/AcrR family transcriptional regulator [Ktedonobacteraceae bacterium]
MVGASSQNTSTETRQKAILEAALKSFSTKGFTETTMEDIKRLSGASTGSIYHHFENKEMLAQALYLEGRSDLNASLLATIAGKPPRPGIKDLIYAYLDWFEQHPDLGQFVMQAGSTEYLGSYVKVVRQKIQLALPRENFPEQFFEWLSPFIEDGSIARFPRNLYVPLVIGPSREYVRRWLRTRIISEIHEARELLAEAAWKVLSPLP